jgi:hypothetical protein
MNTLRRLLIALLPLTGTLAFAADSDAEVINFVRMGHNPDGTFERSYQYSFGDWQKAKSIVQVQGQGLIINLAGSKGGVGENRGLDFGKFTHARITFVIGNRNKAEAFGFTLVDRDGTDEYWEIPIKGMSKGADLSQLIDLTKPTRVDKPGKKPGLDFKKLETWQFKGNYQDAPVELLLMKVMAVSE